MFIHDCDSETYEYIKKTPTSLVVLFESEVVNKNLKNEHIGIRCGENIFLVRAVLANIEPLCVYLITREHAKNIDDLDNKLDNLLKEGKIKRKYEKVRYYVLSHY